MNASAKVVAVILFVGAMWGCSQRESSDGQLSVADIAVSFPSYQQMTTNVVQVNPEFSRRCASLSVGELDAARVRFGPHANTGILIFMNTLAASAFERNATAYPVGAVIVKQKTPGTPHRTKSDELVWQDAGVGGMVKRSAGYDPEHGDWEYFYFEDTKKIENGPIASCIQCHTSAQAHDYVFGTWRTAR